MFCGNNKFQSILAVSNILAKYISFLVISHSWVALIASLTLGEVWEMRISTAAYDNLDYVLFSARKTNQNVPLEFVVIFLEYKKLTDDFRSCPLVSFL